MNYQTYDEINEIIYLLSTYLSFHPEIRVGQAISNAARSGGWTNYDVFYCPNDVLINGLKEMCSQLKGGRSAMKEYYSVELWENITFVIEEVESEEEALEKALRLWHEQKPCFEIHKLDPNDWE